MTTFDELFVSHRLKPPEREALVWHLAYMRMRKTIEVLQAPAKTIEAADSSSAEGSK